MTRMLSAEELEAALREIGEERYHWNHQFHIAMKNGRLTKPQVQAWALNRYYFYQSRIPIKDAAILARMDDAELRRAWQGAVIDHDGERAGEGEIERWLKLTDGLGLDRTYVISTEGVLPATRFAVDAYVHFVRERPLLEAIASSLTEMFSPRIIADRVSGMLANYDFVSGETLAYFQRRLDRAPRCRFRARLRQARGQTARSTAAGTGCAALQMRRAVVQLDALEHAYVTPGNIPHGAFRPELA